MTPKTLSLQKEHLVELTTDELSAVVAGNTTTLLTTMTQFSVCSMC